MLSDGDVSGMVPTGANTKFARLAHGLFRIVSLMSGPERFISTLKQLSEYSMRRRDRQDLWWIELQRSSISTTGHAYLL